MYEKRYDLYKHFIFYLNSLSSYKLITNVADRIRKTILYAKMPRNNKFK